MTAQMWYDHARTLIRFTPIAHLIGQEFADAMLPCIESPGALELFVDFVFRRIHIDLDFPSTQRLVKLMGYITIPFYLAFSRHARLEPVTQLFIRGGIVTLITKALAFAHDLSFRSDILFIPFIQHCAIYLFRTLGQERYSCTLEALKGPLGVLTSISRASEVLFMDDDIERSERTIEVYANVIDDITSKLIHPAVMRRCARRLAKHPLMLDAKDTRFQLLVDASKSLVQAVAEWKSKRNEYKQRNHSKLCDNVQCPHSGVKSTSFKFCVGCLTTVYCSPTCQKCDWKLHRTRCNAQALEYFSRRENETHLISLPFYRHYLHWNMKNAARSFIDAPDGRAPCIGEVIELDYTSHPVEVLVIPVDEFLTRLEVFKNYEPSIRAAMTRRQGTGAFIYGIIPNGRYYSFPLLLSLSGESGEVREKEL
ncbi:hypothetical protein C8J56DRAFT_1131047 [Mycena floridula]|nr:hypothetical protein C8J56DRAFT_1131047 [Mycena floridula]